MAWMKERESGEKGRWRGELNWSSHDTQEEQEGKGGERKKQERDPWVPVSPTSRVRHSPGDPIASL